MKGHQKMNKRFSILMGSTLILSGILIMVFNQVMPILGLNVWSWETWRLWPLTILGGGGFLILLTLLLPYRRGLGLLFIPSGPILATGAILLLASLFDRWEVWAWLWPLELWSLALGFLFAAIYMRLVWLIIPAIIVGLNGVIMQFCAITGLWEAWAVLWTAEPLAVGISLIAVSVFKRSTGLFVAGAIVAGLAGLGLVGMTAILSGWKLISLFGGGVLILVGFLWLGWELTYRPSTPNPA
jgi:hypothetical protein